MQFRGIAIVMHSIPFITAGYSLGRIDDTLIARLFAEANTTDLYMPHSGLYLLPHNVTVQGYVDSICIFGLFKSSLVHLILNEDGRIDLQSAIRAFVYALHYRPLVEDPTTYRMVSKPAIVYHHITEGCISYHDGLDWQVQRRDKIGVFIPDNCSSSDQLQDLDVYSSDFDGKLLCPSQVNLAIDDEVHSNVCSYAYYLNVSLEELEMAEISEEELTYEETVLNVEVVIIRKCASKCCPTETI